MKEIKTTNTENMENTEFVSQEQRLIFLAEEREKLVATLRHEKEMAEIAGELNKTYMVEIAGILKTGMIIGLGAYITHAITTSNERIEKHRIEFNQD